MSFFRHEEIFRSDVGVLDPSSAGRPPAAAPPLIVSMSFRLAIPWTVALQQSRPPLRQPSSASERISGLAMVCQRTASTVTYPCLRRRVQSPISTDMASRLERPSHPQSVTSRSHTNLKPISSSLLAVSATISSISAVAPLPLARVTHLISFTSRSRKTFARLLAHPPCGTARERSSGISGTPSEEAGLASGGPAVGLACGLARYRPRLESTKPTPCEVARTSDPAQPNPPQLVESCPILRTPVPEADNDSSRCDSILLTA